LRQRALQEGEFIDFGVVMEGEQTLVELCRGQGSGSIPGLIHRQGEDILYNGDRPFVENLEAVPFPTFERFELEKYSVKEIPIVSSRGCPYSCIFCPVKLAIGRRYRARSAQSVAEEIEYWYYRGYRRFDFVDDNFTLLNERVYQVCDEIEKRGLEGLRLHCGNGIRADRVDRKLLERMRGVGFDYIAFGVEAGNNKVLARLKKGETIEVVERAIKDACDLGYEVTLFFLLGSPGETREDVMDSVALAQRYPVADVRFYNIIPFPGTELAEWLAENCYFLRQPEDYLSDSSAWIDDPLFITPEMGYGERKRLRRYVSQVTRSVFRRRIQRKLGRYGPLGKVGATFYCSDLMQKLVTSNQSVNRLVKKLAGRLAR
jgi:radical SAM superfamily enzyme YgiQ (UPF0313 family)